MSIPITYSSEITLSLAKFPQIYLYSDGFMKTDLQLDSFHKLHGNLFHDFHNSVFRVLPVINFKWTDQILSDVVHDDFKKLHVESLVKERKNIVQGYIQNLDGEVTQNIALAQKMKGTPLVFVSSQFHLVHVSSLKFLSLNDENTEFLNYELVDFPSQGSVLKFIPCLQFQKLRTNVIYHGDPVILSSSKTVCNRPPQLCSNYIGQFYNDQMKDPEANNSDFNRELEFSRVWASVEDHTRWRVQAFFAVGENDKGREAEDYLHVGDVVALNLSEMSMYLNVLKPYDAFKKILALLQETKKEEDTHLLKKILTDDVIIAFEDIIPKHEQLSKTMIPIPNSCFWKIEAERFNDGGKVAWEKRYRLRHYLTGRYLRLEMDDKKRSLAKLTSTATQDSLFRFCPIENAEMHQGKFLWKDSFYYLMHVETGKYLGITDEDEIEDPIELQEAQKELDVELSQPYLSVVQNHYNTYRMKRISFQETWQTSLLLYSVPFFMEAVNFINQLNNRVKAQKPLDEDDIKSKIQFYRIHQRVIFTLDSFMAFINNKLISNISTNQEYGMIVPQRQDIIRTQNVFVLLCWLLYRSFPTLDEMKLIGECGYEQLLEDFLDEKEFMIRAESFLQNGTIYEHKKALQRLDSHHLKRKLLISYKIYLTIREICKLNATNQLALKKFLDILQNHIGHGQEVVGTLIAGLSSNHKILQSLAQEEIQMKDKQKINFLVGMVNKILEFPPYTRPDIIQFLSSLCSFQDEPLFVNQDMIFRTMIQNRDISKKALMTITFQDGKDLYLEYFDHQNKIQYKKLPDFCNERNEAQLQGLTHMDKQYNYLRSQLDLFANLCLHRNVLACQTFSKIFQLNVIIKYVLSDSLDNEIRAVFQRLIRTLYIDREPYNIQVKPVLVRIIDYDPKILRPIKYVEEPFFFFFKRKRMVTDDESQGLLSQRSSPQLPFLKTPNVQKPKNTPSGLMTEEEGDAEERLSAREEENIKLLLNSFKVELLEFMRIKYELLQTNGPIVQVYNELTFEIVKILEIIMKFGLFWTHIDKPKRLDMPRSVILAKIFERAYQRKLRDFEQQMKESMMEKLINYLTLFLEYDENYFIALNTVNLQRRYVEQKRIKEELSAKQGLLNGIGNLGLGMMSFTNMFQEDQIQKKEKRSIQAVTYESEVVSDPLFKKIKALKKILQKSTNKTFTVKEETKGTNYEVLIKVQICKIFSYLLDVRQDYLVDNLLAYFQKVFVPKVINELDPMKINWDQDFLSMMPEEQVEVGADVTRVKNMTEYVDHPPIVRNFDAIVDRSFYETLVFTLYFSTDAQLQNEIVDLIQKYSSQKRQFHENIQHLQLMMAPEVIEFFSEWNSLLDRLKKIINKCQSWLNIGTPAKQNQRNEANIKRCTQLLLDVKVKFLKNKLDTRGMKTKQRIIMHVGAYSNLVYLMKNCMRMIDTHSHIFRYPDTDDDAVYYQITLAKQIVEILRQILEIFTTFVENNLENQTIILQNVVLMIINYPYQNFGQIKFLNSLFQNNLKIVQMMDKPKIFSYLIRLIGDHGRYPEFLEIFQTVLNSCEDLTQEPELPKSVLAHLIDHHTFENLNPFTDKISNQQEFFLLRYTGYFEKEPDLLEYRSKFFLILAKCLRVEVSVNHIQHVKVFVRMNDLLSFMIEKSKEMSEITDDKCYNYFTRLSIKSSIIDIIMILVDKTQGSLNDLIEQGQLVQEFIQVEIKILEGRNTFNENMMVYLFCKQLPLILRYIEAFFKDASTQLFGASETQKKDRKRLYIYGQTFLNATVHMSSADLMADPEKVDLLIRLSEVLQMPMAPWFSSIERKQVSEVIDDNEDGILITVLNDEQIHEQFDQKLLEQDTQDKAQKQSTTEVSQSRGLRGLLQKIRARFKQKASQPTNTDPRLNREFLIDDDSLKIMELWSSYSSLITDNDAILKAIKCEPLTFSTSLWNVSDMFQSEVKGDQKDLLLASEDIIIKLLYFIEYWKQNRAEKKNVVFVLQILAKILKGTDDQDENEQQQYQEELQLRQDIFDKLNATKILMQLLWNESEVEFDYLKYLLKLFIALLHGGNKSVQKTVYDYSLTNSECEKFYYKLYQILNMTPGSHKEQGLIQYKCIAKALRLIQLLCEGHNLQMQQYLHHQSNSKNSYDLVVMCTRLLSTMVVNNINYDIVLQCFETITETLQGPCKKNQAAVGNSKFLEYAVSILSEDDKVFETHEMTQHHDEKFVEMMMSKKANKRFKEVQQLLHNPNSHISQRGKLLDPDKRYNLTLHAGKLAKLKYKCLITVVALLECNDLGDNFLLRIIRGIPLPVMIENLLYIFMLYEKYKTRDQYEKSLFCRFDQQIDAGVDDDYYELIIESGFMIYTLMQIFLGNKKGRDILYEDVDMRDILNDFKEDHEKTGSLFQSIGKLGGFMASGLGDLTKGLDNVLKSDEEKKKEAEIKRKAEKKENIKKAIEFFKTHTKQIEILRDDKIATVYFPKLPFCHKLPKDLKEKFHDEVNRKTTKSKLTALMNTTEEFKNTMIHEERLRILFNYNPLLGFFADNGKLWEQAIFLNTFIINIMVCISYSEYGALTGDYPPESAAYKTAIYDARIYEPRFLFDPAADYTFQIIRIFGLIELVLASLIVFFFVIKRAPLKIYGTWKGFTDTKGFFKIIGGIIVRSTKSLIILLQDFDILYYSIYILSGIIGLIVHPFLFAVHLMDFLKLDQLKTVVQAMWQPKIELGLTFLLMIIIQYYFTILGWVIFYMDYDYNQIFTPGYEYFCNQFWLCLIQTFNWTFKFTGSIGTQLHDPNTYYYEDLTETGQYNMVNQHFVDVYVGRFVFDNLFNLILVFILLNMIQGIIIDTFGSLREELAERQNDQKFICFVCGIDMEKLDKSSESDKGFTYHIRIEHYMWNYLFYRAYIEQKDPTEFDGNDSFVMDKIQNSDLSWFPIGRAGCVQDDDQEDAIRSEILQGLNGQNNIIEDKIKKLEQRSVHVKTQLQHIVEDQSQ